MRLSHTLRIPHSYGYVVLQKKRADQQLAAMQSLEMQYITRLDANAQEMSQVNLAVSGSPMQSD